MAKIPQKRPEKVVEKSVKTAQKAPARVPSSGSKAPGEQLLVDLLCQVKGLATTTKGEVLEASLPLARHLGVFSLVVATMFPRPKVAQLDPPELPLAAAFNHLATTLQRLSLAQRQGCAGTVVKLAAAVGVPFDAPEFTQDRRGQHWQAKRPAANEEVVEYVVAMTEDKETTRYEVTFNELRDHFTGTSHKVTSRPSLEARISNGGGRVVIRLKVGDETKVVRDYVITRLRPTYKRKKTA